MCGLRQATEMYMFSFSVFPSVFKILNREVWIKLCASFNFGLHRYFETFILAKTVCAFWSALRQKCSHLFGSLPPAWWKVCSSPQKTHTHTRSHLSLFFLKHYLPFHCLFFLTLPVWAVCVNGSLLCFVVDPLQAQLCLTRVLRLSKDIDMGLSLCVWISVS